MKTDFDESIGKHQYHSAGYWKSVVEFIQQCVLCSLPTAEKIETGTGGTSEPASIELRLFQ